MKCKHFDLAKIAARIKKVQEPVKAKDNTDRYQQEKCEWGEGGGGEGGEANPQNITPGVQSFPLNSRPSISPRVYRYV